MWVDPSHSHFLSTASKYKRRQAYWLTMSWPCPGILRGLLCATQQLHAVGAIMPILQCQEVKEHAPDDRVRRERTRVCPSLSPPGLVPAYLPGSTVTASSVAPLFDFILCPTVSAVLLNHKSDHATSFKAFHRLSTDLEPQSELFGQGPSRLSQTSLFGLLCPSPTCPPYITPGPEHTTAPCVAHVSNVISPITCQNNSYSSFKTQLRHGPSPGKPSWLPTLGPGVFTCFST